MYHYLQGVMGGTAGAGSNISSVAGFVTILANLFIIIAAGVSFISLTLSLIQYITSTGDVKAVEKAQRGVLWGLIGLVVSILAFTIKNVIVSSAGITGLQSPSRQSTSKESPDRCIPYGASCLGGACCSPYECKPSSGGVKCVSP